MDVLYICAILVLTALLCGLVRGCVKLGNKQ